MKPSLNSHNAFIKTYTFITNFLCTSSSEACASRDLFFFLFVFCLFPDFHEMWHSMMSACCFTDVKQQWAT